MLTSYLSDPGKVRSHNEDSVTIVSNSSEEYLLVVADGMGGHKAGEIASSLVVTHLGKRFSELGSIGSEEDAISWLKDNIAEINLNILKYTEENLDSKGMGTTCVCAIISKEFLLFGNVGDSSGYVFKNKKLYKVTHDHTLVNVLVETGELTEEEAKEHPKKNVLMRALGASEKVEIDIFEVETDVDGVFLCSDGLTNMLTVEQIEKVLNDEELSIDGKLNKLIKKSNSRGGTDNITVAYAVKESGVASDC